MHVVLVTGPPCSGKTTYVAEHKQPGDVVVDYDALAVALGSDVTHGHHDSLRPFVMAARTAVLKLITNSHTGKAWVISTDPHPYLRKVATERVDMDTPLDECRRRAIEAGRPEVSVSLIDQWSGARGWVL